MPGFSQDQADQPIRAMAINGVIGIERHIMLLFRISGFSMEQVQTSVSTGTREAYNQA